MIFIIKNFVFLLIMPSVLSTRPTCSSERVHTYLEGTMEDINEVCENYICTPSTYQIYLFFFILQKRLIKVDVADCKSPCRYNYTYGHEEISVLMQTYALENYIDGCFCKYSKSHAVFEKFKKSHHLTLQATYAFFFKVKLFELLALKISIKKVYKSSLGMEIQT